MKLRSHNEFVSQGFQAFYTLGRTEHTTLSWGQAESRQKTFYCLRTGSLDRHHEGKVCPLERSSQKHTVMLPKHFTGSSMLLVVLVQEVGWLKSGLLEREHGCKHGTQNTEHGTWNPLEHVLKLCNCWIMVSGGKDYWPNHQPKPKTDNLCVFECLSR